MTDRNCPSCKTKLSPVMESEEANTWKCPGCGQKVREDKILGDTRTYKE